MKYLTGLFVFLVLILLDVVLLAFFCCTLLLGALWFSETNRDYPLSYSFARKLYG